MAAPKQRNSDAEKVDIKAGKVPNEWQNADFTKLGQRFRMSRASASQSRGQGKGIDSG
ncbi:hypothetical protein NKI04_34750 [Mesorhizobium sp. M0814]|uniref:hypothetical protein n=1 Tax=Mesorhizobium sp. M0814 TaxID=2957004 RepID=UPI00333CE8DB